MTTAHDRLDLPHQDPTANPSRPERIAVYVRIASATVAEPTASIDRQAASIAAWLRANGWTLEPFTDTERGSRFARPVPGLVAPGRASRTAAR